MARKILGLSTLFLLASVVSGSQQENSSISFSEQEIKFEIPDLDGVFHQVQIEITPKENGTKIGWQVDGKHQGSIETEMTEEEDQIQWKAKWEQEEDPTWNGSFEEEIPLLPNEQVDEPEIQIPQQEISTEDSQQTEDSETPTKKPIRSSETISLHTKPLEAIEPEIIDTPQPEFPHHLYTFGGLSLHNKPIEAIEPEIIDTPQPEFSHYSYPPEGVTLHNKPIEAVEPEIIDTPIPDFNPLEGFTFRTLPVPKDAALHPETQPTDMLKSLKHIAAVLERPVRKGIKIHERPLKAIDVDPLLASPNFIKNLDVCGQNCNSECNSDKACLEKCIQNYCSEPETSSWLFWLGLTVAVLAAGYLVYKKLLTTSVKKISLYPEELEAKYTKL